jgi:hypothetical protein
MSAFNSKADTVGAFMSTRPSVFGGGVDRLLDKLIAKHGAAGRSDIAPEIAAATRVTARHVQAAAEMARLRLEFQARTSCS